MTLRSLRSTLAAHRSGVCDPTTQLSERSFLHATHTPDGPATLLLRWAAGSRHPWPSPASPRGVGPGRSVDARGVDELTGSTTTPVQPRPGLSANRSCCGRCRPRCRPISAPAAICITGCCRRSSSNGSPRSRLAASGDDCVVHSARRRPGRLRSSAACCCHPRPMISARQPIWWFHRHGIEAKRAGTLIEVARHHDKLWSWCRADPSLASDRLRRSPASARGRSGRCSGPCLGDADAVPVGDFHLPNIVAWNLAGEPPSRRSPHARSARAVSRSAWPGGQRAGAGRAPGAGIRSASANPSDPAPLSTIWPSCPPY